MVFRPLIQGWGERTAGPLRRWWGKQLQHMWTAAPLSSALGAAVLQMFRICSPTLSPFFRRIYLFIHPTSRLCVSELYAWTDKRMGWGAGGQNTNKENGRFQDTFSPQNVIIKRRNCIKRGGLHCQWDQSAGRRPLFCSVPVCFSPLGWIHHRGLLVLQRLAGAPRSVRSHALIE